MHLDVIIEQDGGVGATQPQNCPGGDGWAIPMSNLRLGARLDAALLSLRSEMAESL